MASITKEAKLALASRDHDFHEDGLSLFYHVVSQLFTATFSNAQATHDSLSDFHPKQFKYDIIQVNNYISSAVMTLKAASSAGGTITDQEILYFQFKVYKKIKALAEWTTHILFLESMVASTPTYTPFNETQVKYTTLLIRGCGGLPTRHQRNRPWPWLPNSSKPRKVPTIQQSPSPTPGRVPKQSIRIRRAPLLPIHLVNLVTPSSGMARHTTGALPTTNTPIGIHTRWRSATPTRK